MIDVSNLKDALETLGFVAHGDIHEKVFPEIGCSLKVDFHAKKLIYPNEIKGRERNNGFDKKENFVVFECVCRLLSKGYRPEHIELEKEWHLGHDPKGGRADICVTDTSGNMLFIIECKTWGREYDKALNNTKSDGAQLFSYWQQEQSCKWLVLYASDLKGGCIVHKASTIDCSDDANIVLLSKKDKSIKLYRDANTASAKYEAWKETYGRQIHDDLIFSKDSVAYQIGVKPLRKKDLRDFTPDDKIVNKFEEILRHMYGDNVIEKHGINRDRTGDREKTRYLCGKQGIFTRDRALIRPGSIRQLETRASTRSASFFHALGGPTTAAALLGHIVPTTGRNP